MASAPDSDRIDQVSSVAPAEPAGASAPNDDGELSPSAYEMLCRFVGEPGAIRLRRYMCQNVQYNENSFLCLDTLLEAVVLEAAAGIPLQIATGLEELKRAFGEEAHQRQTSFEEFLRRFASVQSVHAKLVSNPPQTAPGATRRLPARSSPPPPEPRFQRVRAFVWFVCRALMHKIKAPMVGLIFTSLGVWIGKTWAEKEGTQQFQQQQVALLTEWRNQEIALQGAWLDRQTERLTQEQARLTAAIQRRCFEQAPRQPGLPVPAVVEPVNSKNVVRKSSR